MSLCTPDVQDTASDQRPLDHRRDVLVYQTAPLTADMEICGDVVVKLFAASSAPDTDFTAKLVDVHPDGLAVGLCYGIDISSSNFPFFDRNHNTGRPFYADADLAVASQAVYHTVMYPSGVVLPILPGDGNNG